MAFGAETEESSGKSLRETTGPEGRIGFS